MGTPYSDGTIVKLLLDNGYHAVRVTLPGHSGHISTMKNADAAQWLSSAYIQYGKEVFEAQKDGLPIYLAAFSLGALVFEVLMNEETAIPVRFTGAVLFAPAIATKNISRSVRILNIFGKQMIINSATPVDYRAQRGASLAAYNAFFELENKLCVTGFANNINTLLIIDPMDELVSLRKIKAAKYKLSNWKINEIDNRAARYRHLIIDDKCVGKETWEPISRNLLVAPLCAPPIYSDIYRRLMM
jgi:hypothetical protein